MTDTSRPDGGGGSSAFNRIRSAAMIVAIGALVAVVVHLAWRNFGSDDFARTAGLGGLFLYWWAFGSVIGVVSFIFALKSTRPKPLLDFLGVFAIASTVGVAGAATDFSAGRFGPSTLTVPLLFPLAQFLSVRLKARSMEPRMRRSNTSFGGEQ